MNRSAQKRLAEIANEPFEHLDGIDLTWYAIGRIDAMQNYINKLQSELADAKQANSYNRDVLDDMYNEISELRKDRERLDAIEDMVRNSRTGVTFKHENYSEDGYVVERGFNITRYHFRSELEKTLREAIDNSMKEVQP